MVQVVKAFRDAKDGLKKYNVGDKNDFGAARNKELEQKGFVKLLKKPKSK